MFAVPGWAISPDTLTRQKEPSGEGFVHKKTSEGVGVETRKSGKRKRKSPRRNTPERAGNNSTQTSKKHVGGAYKEGHHNEVQATAYGGSQKRKFKAASSRTSTASNKAERHSHMRVFETKDDSISPRQGKSMNKGSHQSQSSEMLAVKPNLKQVQHTEPPSKAVDERRIPTTSPRRHQQPVVLSNGTQTARDLSTSNTSALPNTAETKSLSPPGVDSPASTFPHPKATLSSTTGPRHLTSLQSAMHSKLVSARFRHLNETLYTTSSADALQLFSHSPSSFASYHTGFRAQVAAWPQNPIDQFIEDIAIRAKVRKSKADKNQNLKRKGTNLAHPSTENTSSSDPLVEPLPRSRPHYTCTVADLGCGDALLAASLLPLCSSHSLRLLSYDLCQGDFPNAHLITVADTCHLPLANGEVDLAILCLALMGTNWVECVDEVSRVVRPGGEVWVAEVKSRFPKKTKGPGRPDLDEDSFDDVGGTEDVTDVSLFVSVWQKRGFALKGDADMSNKMFVRLRFIKNRADLSRSRTPDTANYIDRKSGEKRHRKSFLYDPGEAEPLDEAKALKPCLYKKR